MTGIESLREVVNELGRFSFCYDLYVRLSNIADQIEREITPHERRDEPADDHAADVSMSAYDLLPPDEREAIAWVREHGGLGHVKDICHDFRAVVERLGIEWSESELHNVMDVLDKRLMPEGMEWPRFEDGEPVKFGDKVPTIQRVTKIGLFSDGSFTLYNGFDSVPFKRGEHVKRPAPKVLDADGVEIRVGDTVWDVEFGCEHVVTKVSDGAVFVAFEDESADRCDPASLTHRAPVFAADGRPLREGETVWHVETGREYVVVEPSYGKTVVVRLAKYDDAEGEQYAPDQLTHERPESKCRDCAHWQKDPTANKMGVCWFFYHEHEGQDCFPARRADVGACEEFMPRAGALAERERGE